MDFALSPEHVSLRDMVRSFVEKEVRPHARKWDEEGKFPAGTVAMMGELGLMGAMVPEEYGGSGMDTVGYAIIVEEI
ncbi:MAG: acyl-CoA dehydrogenase family protein, partial [Deltaproteobacteria bacterium]|nr:acyl-CoA dehydrogenase family protein [Deltaproteobacteria bacterium]